MSPTVFRARGLRFFFFLREEPRLQVHVQGSGGEAKFRVGPEIELAQNHGTGRRSLTSALRLIREHESEIRSAWKAQFGR